MNYKDFKQSVFSGGSVGTFLKLWIALCIPFYGNGYQMESALNFAQGGNPNDVTILGNWGERFKNGLFANIGTGVWSLVPVIGSLIGYTATANFIVTNFNFGSFWQIGDVFKAGLAHLLKAFMDLIKLILPPLLVLGLASGVPAGLFFGLSAASIDSTIAIGVSALVGLVLGLFCTFYIVNRAMVYYPYIVGTFIKENLGLQPQSSFGESFGNSYSQPFTPPSQQNYFPNNDMTENVSLGNLSAANEFGIPTPPPMPADVIAYFNERNPQLSGSYIRNVNGQLYADALNRTLTIGELLKLDGAELLAWNNTEIRTKLYQAAQQH